MADEHKTLIDRTFGAGTAPPRQPSRSGIRNQFGMGLGLLQELSRHLSVRGTLNYWFCGQTHSFVDLTKINVHATTGQTDGDGMSSGERRIGADELLVLRGNRTQTQGSCRVWDLITTTWEGLCRALRRANSRFVIIWRKAWDLSSSVAITRLARTFTTDDGSEGMGRREVLLSLLVPWCEPKKQLIDRLKSKKS